MPLPLSSVKRNHASGKPNKLGNFNTRAPNVPKLPYATRSERMAILLGQSSREAAKKFGVDHSTILSWRKSIQKLEIDRPRIWSDLGFSSNAIKFAKTFYEQGGNELRRELGLTKVGTDGLLAVLAIYGYVREPRMTYLASVAKNMREHGDTAKMSEAQFCRWFAKKYNSSPIMVKQLLGGKRGTRAVRE
jgi:hypothetical protein